MPLVRDAHRRGDEDALRRGYAFARWCLQQGGHLRNAAAVSFDEHLFDSWDVHASVLQHLNHQETQEGWPHWECRLDSDKLEVLRARLQS